VEEEEEEKEKVSGGWGRTIKEMRKSDGTYRLS
jgi:hypothetical protein